MTPEPSAPHARRRRESHPQDRDYDPHDAVYPNPMLGMFGIAMLAGAMMPDFGAPASESSSGDEDHAGVGDGAGGSESSGGLFDMEW